MTSRSPTCISDARLCIKTGSTGRVSTLLEMDEFAREGARLGRGVAVVEFDCEFDVDMEAGVVVGRSNMFLREETFLISVSASDPFPAAIVEFDVPASDTAALISSECCSISGTSLYSIPEVSALRMFTCFEAVSILPA
jgi:hypothetical protein